MSCTVAVSNSPVFSPSSSLSQSPLFRKPSSFPPLFSRISSPSSRLPPCSSSSSPSSLNLASTTCRSNCSDDGPSTSNSASKSCSSPTTTGTTAILKRKRPARLNIPAMDLGFSGSSAATPRPVVVEDTMVEAERDGYYSVCCKRGRRAAMEDRYSAALEIEGNPKQALYGIFDGHGGSKAAEFSSENLNKNITEELASTDINNNDNIKEAVKQAYLKTDTDFLKKQENHGGTCCVTALIKDGNLIVSNAGDCRAVMSLDGVAVPLTTDHRPSREDEKQRIEATGGYVDCYRGVWRIQGTLAVSRGIGDRQLKQWVIAEPETKICRIENECEFLILASDGLWDKVNNQEAVDIVRQLVKMDTGGLVADACRKLVDVSVSRGSVDDVSVMIVMLDPYV